MTPRELECLHWIAQGKTTQETAIILGVSCETVRGHLKNVRREMNSYTIAACVYKGMKLGLLT